MNNEYIKGKFDPIILNAIYFDQRAPFEKQIPRYIKPHGMWYYIWRIIIAILKEFMVILYRFPIKQWFVGWNYYKDSYDEKIMFVLPSDNNLRSLEKVLSIVNRKRNNVVLLHKREFYKCVPRFRLLLISVLKVPFLISSISHLSNKNRRIAGYYISSLLLAPGYTYCFSKLLQLYKPECVVLSNDHSCNCKALIYLCEQFNIPTVYVQHASVSYAFPELHFKCSFLDGMDALEKYMADNKKATGDVIVLGAVRYDNLSSYRINRVVGYRQCIGIAINLLDDNLFVNDFCNQILKHLPNITIKVRSHPSMKNKPFVFDEKVRLVYSCASDESIISYLDSIDVQVSGDSGVHLDSLIGGIPSLAYNFSSKNFTDNYGYIKCGLIPYYSDIQEVIGIIRDSNYIKPEESKMRQFDDSYGKRYAGKCSEIVADFISKGCNLHYVKDKYNMQKEYLQDNSFLKIYE